MDSESAQIMGYGIAVQLMLSVLWPLLHGRERATAEYGLGSLEALQARLDG